MLIKRLTFVLFSLPIIILALPVALCIHVFVIGHSMAESFTHWMVSISDKVNKDDN